MNKLTTDQERVFDFKKSEYTYKQMMNKIRELGIANRPCDICFDDLSSNNYFILRIEHEQFNTPFKCESISENIPVKI